MISCFISVYNTDIQRHWKFNTNIIISVSAWFRGVWAAHYWWQGHRYCDFKENICLLILEMPPTKCVHLKQQHWGSDQRLMPLLGWKVKYEIHNDEESKTGAGVESEGSRNGSHLQRQGAEVYNPRSIFHPSQGDGRLIIVMSLISGWSQAQRVLFSTCSNHWITAKELSTDTHTSPHIEAWCRVQADEPHWNHLNAQRTRLLCKALANLA